jgi:DNA repair exonuclease SbcCD ATPase subunit
MSPETPTKAELRARIAELETNATDAATLMARDLKRIAELERDNERAVAFGQASVTAGADWMRRAEQAEEALANMTEDRNGFRDAFTKCIERAEQAEAELAALKARRCDTCGRKARGCSIREIALRLYGGRDFGCQFWTWDARAEEGSES